MQQITSDKGDVQGLPIKYHVSGGKKFFETLTLFSAFELLAKIVYITAKNEHCFMLQK